MKDLREILGEMLKKDRLAQKKTLRVFCEETGMEPSTLSRIERGRAAKIESEDLEKIGTGLGLDKNSKVWKNLKIMVNEINETPLRELTEEELDGMMPLIPVKSDGEVMTEEELKSLRETLKNA